MIQFIDFLLIFFFFSQVEYILVKFDEENKVARVSLRAPELLAILNQKEADDPKGIEIGTTTHEESFFFHSC